LFSSVTCDGGADHQIKSRMCDEDAFTEYKKKQPGCNKKNFHNEPMGRIADVPPTTVA
jgi:hypothetical protein